MRSRYKILSSLLSFILLFSVVINYSGPALNADSDVIDIYVHAHLDDSMYVKWLPLKVIGNQWYISAENACVFGGFKNYSIDGNQISFTRPVFWDTDVIDVISGGIHYDTLTIRHTETPRIIDGINYYNFDSIMDDLRTIVVYSPFDDTLYFDNCDYFPVEISKLCDYLITNDRYYMPGADEANPLAAFGLHVSGLIVDVFNGVENDYGTVLKKILKTPAISDPEMTSYFHYQRPEYDFVGRLLSLEDALTANNMSEYTSLYSYVGLNTDSIFDYSNLERSEVLQFIRDVRAVPSYFTFDDPTLGDLPIHNTMEIDRYKDEILSWNNAYANAINIAIVSDNSLSEYNQLKISSSSIIDTYHSTDYAMNLTSENLRNLAGQGLINAIKAQLATPHAAFIAFLDQELGFSQSISEANQTYVVNKIQCQCRDRTLDFSLMKDVWGYKYTAILYLRSYMYACSLWEDGSALSNIATLTSDDKDLITSYYSGQIDEVAPILAMLIQINDTEYAFPVHNVIGDGSFINSHFSTFFPSVSQYFYSQWRAIGYASTNPDFEAMSSRLSEGLHFYYGEYEQDNNPDNGPELIEWVVDSRDGNVIEAHSLYILDHRLYGGEDWCKTSLRRWLNYDFYNQAFSDLERPNIIWHHRRSCIDGGDWRVADKDYSSIDHIYVKACDAAVSTDYALRDGAFGNNYWIGQSYYNIAWGSMGTRYVDGTGAISRGTFDAGIGSRSYGVRPCITLCLDDPLSHRYDLIEQASLGDIIVLGHQELDGNPDNGDEELEWIVLGRNGNNILIQSFYPMCDVSGASNDDERYAWLNGEFFENSFEDYEKSLFVNTPLSVYNGSFSAKLFVASGNVPIYRYSYDGEVSSGYNDYVRFNVSRPLVLSAWITLDGDLLDNPTVQQEYTHENPSTIDYSDLYIGNTITFGSFEQDMIGTDGREDIEWIVAGLNEDSVTLISKYCLLFGNRSEITLTTDFYNAAFTPDQQSLITPNGSRIVYLLNQTELDSYSQVLPDLNICYPTYYSYWAYYRVLKSYDITSSTDIGSRVAEGYYCSPNIYGLNVFDNPCDWWLSDYTNMVCGDGSLRQTQNTRERNYARPVIRIGLSFVDVSNEEELNQALYENPDDNYIVRLTSDIELEQEISEERILHGVIAFNGYHLYQVTDEEREDYQFDDQASVPLRLWCTEHTPVTDPEVPPTCTEPGYTEGSHCSQCGMVFVAQEEIPATGHTEEIDPEVPETCTETGLTEGSHCSVCGEVIIEQEEIPAAGHTPVVDEAVAPDLSHTGLTEGSHCSVCGEIIVEQEVVPSLTPEPSGAHDDPPAPTGEPTPIPVITPVETPSPTPATPTPAPATEHVERNENGVNGFVERLYTVALGRNSDPAGQQQWVDTITSGQNTGADVARGFLYSPEFLNKNSTDEEFVRTLYRTFFGREADEGGLNAWVGVLGNGEERQNVIEGFINSTEWANLCLTYGIPSGGTGTPNIEVEPNQDTIDFATRLYTTCLNRNADEAGLMAWARQLANQRDTGTGAARGFFFSSEFINQNVGNGEYVTRLYRTFMGREPDQAGYDAWVGQLDSGVSREEVFNGFAQSQEFTRICARYGIIRGS